MNNNRLFRILYYILDKGKVTAKELSEKFEVSERTIYRDIDNLSGAGVPIFAKQGKGGGIEIADDFILRSSLLSKDEKERIMTALKGQEATNENNEELLSKLAALFKVKKTNWIEVDFTNWQNNNSKKVFDNIKEGIINKKIITFTYYSSKEETNRKVKPVRLVFKGQSWYLYGFCLLRNDFRFFKLSRIENFELSDFNFTDDYNDIVLNKEINNEETIQLKVKFDKKAAFRVFDELGRNTIEDKDGYLYAEIEIPKDYQLYSYIFSYGDLIEVLEPKEIREKIKEITKNISKKYIT